MASKNTQCPLYTVVGQGDCDWHYTSQGSIGVAACGVACDAEPLCEKFTYGSILGCRISKCGTNPGGTSCLNGQCPLASGYGGSVYSMDTQLTVTECDDWRAAATHPSGGTVGGSTLSPPSSYTPYPRGCWEWMSGAYFYYNEQPHPLTGSANSNARPICKDPCVFFEYDFSGGITASPGWSTGGDDPASAGTVGPYAFLKNEGGTTSVATGPSNGVGGSGSSYVYAEVTSPRQPGDLYTLAYDGSACGGSVSTVTFHYHMYGATMGELRMSNAAEEVVWSLSGDQGNSWQVATVNVNSASFAFEYERGSSFTGDAAVAQVTVRCG
jgi:hypothetical protein